MAPMFDIEHFVYGHFDDVKISKNDYVVCCVFCENRVGSIDTKYHLRISINKPVVHCFRCAYKNSWVGMIIDITKFSYMHAIGELYRKPAKMTKFDRTIMDKQIKTTAHATYSLPKDFVPLERSFGKDASMAKTYLVRRGFGKYYWIRYGLGLADSVPGRIIIPIEDGYWQGRSIFKWLKPKYINPSQPSSDVLFNADALFHYDEIVICEGAFSAMAVGENAIALIGKEPTVNKQDRIVKSSASKFIIALEPNAYISMKSLMDALYKAGKEVEVWSYKIGDPADKDGEFVSMKYDLKTMVELLLL